ncbi:MAG: PAS domain-containing protein, partial [Alphaproteobacteria bacterium]|nr:PAS domain-containing protein [Alphaproteobacteria bacterium]
MTRGPMSRFRRRALSAQTVFALSGLSLVFLIGAAVAESRGTVWLSLALLALGAICVVLVMLIAVGQAGSLRHMAAKGRRADWLEQEVHRRTQELQASELRLQGILDSMPEFAWTANPAGEVDYINPGLVDFLGVKPSQLRTEPAFERFHPEDREQVERKWQLSLREGRPLEAEVRLRRHDGRYFWVLARARPVRDARGLIERWIGVNTLIEDLKQAQLQAEHAARAKSAFLA